MEFFAELGYIGLFASAFLAATILPLSSEVVLTALLLAGLPPGVLVGVATAGNVLGALTNYLLGYWAGTRAIKKWLKMSDDEVSRAQHRYQKYGAVSLCFAWVPFIGDPLTVVAGLLKVNLLVFLGLVSLGKCLRYVAILYLLPYAV